MKVIRKIIKFFRELDPCIFVILLIVITPVAAFLDGFFIKEFSGFKLIGYTFALGILPIVSICLIYAVIWFTLSCIDQDKKEKRKAFKFFTIGFILYIIRMALKFYFVF